LAEEFSGAIRYFRADLLEPGSYGEAMEGCELVYHTASPFRLAVDDPQRDLVEPAEQGTRNVLQEANHSESVRRVVVTSSVAAIYGDNADLQDLPADRFDERHWNTTSSLDHQPYSYSKTRAEKEAWRLADQQNRWQLVTVNPSLVIGPGIQAQASSESFQLIKQFGDGTFSSGVPDIGMGLVDVRDVAEAHFQAGIREQAHGRYIVSGHDSSFPEIAKVLRQRFGDRYPIPKRTLPKWLVWTAGPWLDSAITRRFVSRNVGYPFRADNGKSRRELGMEYRPLEQSLEEFFEQLFPEAT